MLDEGGFGFKGHIVKSEPGQGWKFKWKEADQQPIISPVRMLLNH